MQNTRDFQAKSLIIGQITKKFGWLCLALFVFFFVCSNILQKMKNQGEELSIEQYRLQLNKIKKEEENLQLQKEQASSSMSIYNIRELPMTISSYTAWAYFCLHYFWILHLIICFQGCFQTAFQKGPSWGSGLIDTTKSLNTVGYIVNGPLLVLVVISILFSKEEKEIGILTIPRYIGAKTFPILRYIVTFCLYSTSFFALNADALSIILFILSAFLMIIKTSFLINFTLRKDQFCCKSFEFLLFDRVITIVSLSFGIGGVNLLTSQNQLLIWGLIQALLGVSAIFCYFYFGIYTYRFKVPRYLLFLLNITFCSVTLAMLFTVFQNLENGSFNFSFHAFLCLFVLAYLTYQMLERRSRLSQISQNKNLKEKIFFLFNKFQNSDNDNEDDSQIRGILHFHTIHGCKNPQCVANMKQVYDSKKKKYCSISKIAQSKVSLVKFYIKCLFETTLQEDPENLEILLDYLQFYFLKLKNVFVVLKMIFQLQRRLLSPIQRLRLVRLKRVLREENNSFAEDLFLGKLSMEHALDAEQTFETLVKGINIILVRNQLFWRYIQRDKVFLGDILEITKSNFALVDKLSDKWMNIAKYFDINRRWKLYYLCYVIYIKNEKLKPYMFQDLGNSVQYDNIFKTSNYFIEKTTEKETLFNSIMLYQQNTCFVVTSCDQQKMQIIRVSNYFSRSFDYEPSQIIGSHLYELMPPSIRSFHHKMFVSWAKTGRNRNQNLYQIRKVTPLTKKGYLAPCFKFYKYYILNNGEIEYIAMFKKNKKQEMIILTNDKFQIEAITQSLAQKLRINTPEQYRYFQGINLLILIPMLTKYTQYARDIAQNDEDFIQNDDNQNYFEKQSTIFHGNTEEGFNFLEMKRQINLTNLRMMVPLDFQSVKDDMNSRKQKIHTFEAIKDCCNSMIKKKNFLKFKGELCVRLKDYYPFSASKFYQIDINELQENNRLQKMKLDEQRMQQLSQANSSRDIESSVLMDVDLQMFLQLNKKKNRVTLFPSDNIFIKEDNNQVLDKISHITNIILSIRLALFIFGAILIGVLFFQLSEIDKFQQVNKQFYWINNHQKMAFMLNLQYNIQHMQPGNAIQQSFYIVFYTSSIVTTIREVSFQTLLYDAELNTQQLINPYFNGTYPYPILQNIKCPPQDQIAIFQLLFQSMITLHRIAEIYPTNTMQFQQYYIINNYFFSYYNKSQKIKANLRQKYKALSNSLFNVVSWLGISVLILLVFCFIFTLSRLLKVTSGFTVLVSIFIQMDNLDIKKISKFVNYVMRLFQYLKDNYDKMKCNVDNAHTSNSFIRDLQKPSSQLKGNEQLLLGSAGANLNKKIKKLEVRNEISFIKRKTLCLLVTYLTFLGGILSIPVFYSLSSLSKLSQLQNMGFDLMGNNNLANSIVLGFIQKFRKAQIFREDHYTSFFDQFNKLASSNIYVALSSVDNELGNLIKTVYFEDFCQLKTDIFNSTFQSQLLDFCGSGTKINSQLCEILYKTVTDVEILQRCHTIQSGYLSKGVLIFNNYILGRISIYFNNGSASTVTDVVEINDALKIISVLEVQMSNVWLQNVQDFLSARLLNMIIIISLTFLGMLILHYVFIQHLIDDYLTQNYMTFKRMQKYLIPEFVINKQKIIKAKLVKEGFMKE